MTFSPCDLNYQQQLDDKTSRLIELMADFNPPKPLIFASPQQHYRMRAEFRIWHDGDDIDHIMYDKQTKAPIKITQFPVASLLINQAMQAIIPLLKFNHSLRYKLFQIDYLSTLSGELLISLIYHRQLDEDWTNQATRLKQALINQGLNVQIVGRASKQKICLDRDYVDEKLTVLGREYHYRQVENSFTQPNANINIEMLSWAINQTKNMTGDLLELYCGNGNFSIALAQNFNQVLATEISKASVSTAQHNIKTNQIDNLKIMRLSAEEFTQAINGVITFNRLQGIDLSTYQCETVLVDPPRSGLDMATLEMIANYRNIIYISCNPNTLKQNLEYLTKTHQIKQMALFDQFPYTEHIEVGMVLSNDSK